jgi:hypothetical protein
LTTEIRTSLMGDVTAALKPIESMTGLTDKMREGIAKTFHDEVVQRLQQNPAQLRDYVIARDNARRAPTVENLKKAAAAYKSAARPIIRSLRVQYIQGAGQQQIGQSANRHAVLNEASQRRGGPSVAAPTEKDLGLGPAKPQPGESWQAFNDRRVSAALQGLAG